MLTLSYLFAMVVAESLSACLYHGSGVDGPLRETMEKYFDSFPRTLTTILLASAHGILWRDISDLLEHVNWWLGPLFYAYILVMNLGTLNLISALWVDAVKQVSIVDQHFKLTEQSLRVEDLVTGQMKSLLAGVACINDGSISRDVMVQVLRRKDARSILKELNLDIDSMKAMFKLVDYEQSGSVLPEELCEAVMQLQGSGPNVHSTMILFQTKRVLARLSRLERTTEVRLHNLKDVLKSSTASDLSTAGSKSGRGVIRH
jgi:hypothetical protein